MADHERREYPRVVLNVEDGFFWVIFLCRIGRHSLLQLSI